MAKLKGKAKEDFLKRMARGRAKSKRTNPNGRKSKKAIGKGFSKAVAAEHVKAKRTAAKKKKAAPTKRNAGQFSKRKTKKQTKKELGPKYKTSKYGQQFIKSLGKRNGRRRRNSDDPAEQAAAMFEKFHQRPPAHIVEYEQALAYPEAFAECGDLIELRFFLDEANPEFPLTQFKGTKVLCTVDGENLYFCKGDQSVDFQALDIAADKDMIELGPCTYICYFTTKGFHDFVPTKYWHEFGEENEILPTLCYDRLNKRLFLMGGDYRVKRQGIVN